MTTAAAFAKFNAKTTADEVAKGFDLSGKLVVITGANTGIGYETARSLAAVGARVLLACRSAEKGADAVERIRAAHPKADVALAGLDLASFTSIDAFAANLLEAKIDIFIGNAGVLNPSYRESDGGIEHTVGISHLGHFRLVRALLPKLLAGGGGRVVMLGSEAHRSPKTLDFEGFPLTGENFSQMVSYGQAKLCNTLFANELQRRYGDQGLTACSLHPGNLVTTEIGRGSLLTRFAMLLASPFTKTPSQGAATSVVCALHPDTEVLAGKYLSHCQQVRMSREAEDPAVAKRLWELSEGWCGA
ncbi:MAG: WW domain-containing oxidoreductase [Myxococcota bacterium]|jgi:WW domain-containing oxidoreductase